MLAVGLRSAVRRHASVGSAAARLLPQREVAGGVAAGGVAAGGVAVGGVAAGGVAARGVAADVVQHGSALPVGEVRQIAPGCSTDAAVGCMEKPAVVVMSHNRPEMTRRCLKMLLALPLIEHFSVYVSEDASSHEVVAAAREFGPRVKEVRQRVSESASRE